MTGKDFLNRVANGHEDVLQLVLGILSQTNTPCCVIGGLAVNAYAEPVVSLDLDIAIVSKDLERVCQLAQDAGLKVETFEHSINFTSSKSDLRIQLQSDARYQTIIARAQQKQVLGYQMTVAALEDVLMRKLWAYGDKQRRRSKRQKDLADIARLIETHPGLEEKLPENIGELLR